MSVKILSEVFKDTTLDSNKKLIMLAIADNANEEGFCYPSLVSLQEKTSLSKPTLIKHLKELTENNYLLSKKRGKKKSLKGGGRNSTIYIIYPNKYYKILDDDIKAKFGDDLGQSKPPLPTSQSKNQTKKEVGQSKNQTNRLLYNEPSLLEPSPFKEKSQKENLPEALNLEAFKMWCKYKGKSYSQQGKTLSINKLIKHPKEIQMQMVEQSIMNNYKGLFEIRQPNGGGKQDITLPSEYIAQQLAQQDIIETEIL